MYLSKLELNPRSKEARRDLSQPYELHRTLAHAFPTLDGQDYRAHHGVLFRLEAITPGYARPSVLVQSVTLPNWNLLPADYCARFPEHKEVNPVFTTGQTLGFRLLANPTKKEARPGQSQGRRVALTDVSQGDELSPAQQWLRRKGEIGGFDLLHVLSEGFRLNEFRQSPTASQRSKQQIPHYGVRFDGLLRVRDPQLLAEVVSQGIGSAKAFGFGLLSLMKPH